MIHLPNTITNGVFARKKFVKRVRETCPLYLWKSITAKAPLKKPLHS